MTDRQFDKRLAALEKQVKLLETAATHSFEATRLLSESVAKWGEALVEVVKVVSQLQDRSVTSPQRDEPPGFSMN